MGSISDRTRVRLVGGDLHRRHGLAQVVGHGLAQGDQPDGLLLDVGLYLVQPVVLLEDLGGQGRVAPHDRVDRVPQLGLGKPPQAGASGPQGVQLVFVGLDDMLIHGTALSRTGR